MNEPLGIERSRQSSFYGKGYKVGYYFCPLRAVSAISGISTVTVVSRFGCRGEVNPPSLDTGDTLHDKIGFHNGTEVLLNPRTSARK